MSEYSPSLVFADACGNIMDFAPLAMLGRSGDFLHELETADVVDLPKGAELYVLPDRHPIGVDRDTGEVVVLEENPFAPGEPAYAVATFLPAAYTQTYLPAWERSACAAVLPLFAYTAIGWQDNGFVATAMRVDDSVRQDPETFDMDKVSKGVAAWQLELPDNRLVRHLSHCALTYGCPAAINLFQGREEAPLPSSPVCNANCLGCISYQPGYGPPSPQERIKFTPTPQELAEIAIRHIAHADNPVVSFGQGCEGEPLMVAETLIEAVSLIRKATARGTINLNSNASRPDMVASLAEAGLDSLRISLNSARAETYQAYYRQKYGFAALLESARAMKSRGRFVSLNLFVFPGLTDAPLEVAALTDFIEAGQIDMIQWRNQNIDPDYYLETLGLELDEGIGIRNLIESISLRRGYFNPYLGS